MFQLRHALVDIGGRRTSAAAAANRPAIGGRGDRRNPSRPFGQVSVSAAYWLRLLLITLVLIGVVATLVKLAWSNLTAPPPTSPKTGADTVDAAPARPARQDPVRTSLFR